MQIQSAYSLIQQSGVKVLIFGNAGSGKTAMCATAPQPLILSAESGLLTLGKIIKESGVDIPVIVIKSIQDLYSSYDMFASGQMANVCKTVCLDSLTEIADAVLAYEKARNKDARKAYGEMADEVLKVVRMFRDLQGFNVYMSAKLESDKDAMTGAFVHMPMMPGKQVGPKLPYEFDEVFYAYKAKDAEGRNFHALQTESDQQVTCLKDRSGYLDAVEYPNLTNIFNKILQG